MLQTRGSFRQGLHLQSIWTKIPRGREFSSTTLISLRLRYGLQFALFTKTNSLFFNPLLDFFILWMCVYETCASPYVRQHSCQQEKLHCFWISYDLLHTNSVVTRMKGESEQFWRTSLFLGCPYALFLPCSSPWDLMRSSKHVCCCSYPSHICTQYWNKFALAIIPVSEHTLSGKETIL